VISGSSGGVTGNNVGASKESGEPSHAGNTGGQSVWYTWTAPVSASVTIDTIGSSFDTLLAVYSGTSVSPLSAIASNDDIVAADGHVPSSVMFAGVAGTTYQIAVDGFGGATGGVTLNWFNVAAPPSPPNDAFASAKVIVGSSGRVTGD